MKSEFAGNQNDGTWPTTLNLAPDEFQQCLAVAQLAVELCELKKANTKVPLEKENLNPEKFIIEAWKLIQSARDHVLRAQTDTEYLVSHGGTAEAAEDVVERKQSASLVPFKKLCDPKRKMGDSETIHGVIWKMFTTKRGFDDLFWAYWHDIGQKWRNPTTRKDCGWLKTGAIKPDGTPQRVQMYSDDERQALAALAGDEDKWKVRGQQVLASWKRNGVPPNDFLALAKFRGERNKGRVGNLEKRAKLKHRRPTRNRRAQSQRSRTP
jgi:hypothetical protein